jgi:hypothetical protein
VHEKKKAKEEDEDEEVEEEEAVGIVKLRDDELTAELVWKFQDRALPGTSSKLGLKLLVYGALSY